MKIGMIGLPQTGKKTLFELLTGHTPTEKELISNKPIKGVAEIKDGRFEKLVALYQPKKSVRARIDIELLPKIEKDTIQKGDIFTDINELDAVCHVVRSFQDDSVYHISGSVDPRRDIEMVNAEMILYDLIFVEKRLERLELKIRQINDEASRKEREVLLKLKAELDRSLPLRLLDFSPEEKKAIASYPLVTRKEMMIVLNAGESGLADQTLVNRLRDEYAPIRLDVMQVSAKVESEIARLESEEDRQVFMKEVGISEPAINVMARLCIKTLSLISFFTVGQDEVRQWTVRRGASAPEAAGVIHSDLQKGFIRAETIKYADLIALGSEEKVKEAGKFYLKGKEYIVEDGDVLCIRFSV